MKLLVIVLCLLSERFLIHSISYKRFSWFNHYFLSIIKILDAKKIVVNPSITLALIVIPIVLLVFIIYMLVHTLLFGFVGLIANLGLFFYCIGPQNPFYPSTKYDDDLSTKDSVRNYFSQINSQLFSVIFWYVLGGPIIVLVYRLVSLSQNMSQTKLIANQITDILEWLPARMTVLLYLLVGNFQSGFKLFTRLFLNNPSLNNQMLSECGVEAVCNNDTKEVPMVVAENLIEHAVIVLLVLIALFTLTAWL